MIKELVKSKINDLEDNRTKNFKKEIQNMENEDIPPNLIIKDNKPKCKAFLIYSKPDFSEK